jgi:hypothetical protein
MAKAYPASLLVQIGRVASTSAHIEQETVLHASAMAAQRTGGAPQEFLRMNFAKLRNRWFQLCRENFAATYMEKWIDPLNRELADVWTQRGHIIHGRWKVLGRGKFEVHWYEQKHKGLEDYKVPYTLRELRSFADHLDRILREIHRFHQQPGGRRASLGKRQ